MQHRNASFEAKGAQSSGAVSVFDHVTALCRKFAEQCESPPRPHIADFVARVDEDSQEMLFRNLLAHELEVRRQHGEQPTVGEYERQFPRFAGAVRQMLLESTHTGEVCDTEGTQTVVYAPAASRLGDYQLLRELGRGGMGCVYEAQHVRHHNHLALKTLPEVSPEDLHQFKREFRSLADVNHPNLIGLYNLEADGGQWFFTMELLHGTDFLSYVRPSGRLDESCLRAVLVQLVTGVMALHSRHIIHRDLKPSNVMVTNDGQLKLLDFGLVLEQDRQLSITDNRIMGTPRYMAPEQAAGESVTSASDWYAVGAMLYEALSGEQPFTGPVLRVLQDKQTRDPPAPTDSTLPQDLVDLSMRLLARDPDQRLDALAVAKAVSPTASPVSSATAPLDQLIGREQQLAALSAAFRTLRQTQESSMVFISGRSGEGKTSLAEHFLRSLRQDTTVAVLSGRCYDRESVPFKALDNLIDALASYLRQLPEKSVGVLMPRDVAVLAHMFPILNRVSVVAEAPRARLQSLDEQQVRTRAFAALRELLLRIGDRMPVVMFIDDLQWGDADSAQVMYEVLRPPEAPVVLFLGSFRSDETHDSAFLQEWRALPRKLGVEIPGSEVKVGPLSVDECTELVIVATGKDNDVVRKRARQFAEETGGNPYLLTELIGCFDIETDSFEALPMNEVIAQKLGRLPKNAARLLEVVAVSGQALGVEEASQASDHDGTAISLITQMRNERLVRLVGGEEHGLVDTYHDRIRETVLAEIPGDRQRRLHLALAQRIEQAGAIPEQWIEWLDSFEHETDDDPTALPRVYDLAYHFDAAGEKRKAWICSLFAAEQARRQFALEAAAEQYAIADRNLTHASVALRYRIATGWGQTLMLLGRYQGAAEQLNVAYELVPDAEKKAYIELLQGELAFKQGQISESMQTLESALRRLRVSVPRSTAGFAYGVVRESVIQCTRSFMPIRRRKATRNQRRLELIVRLLARIAQPYIFHNTLKLIWAHLGSLNRVELLSHPALTCYVYAQHATVMAMLGWHTRGQSYGDRSMALARKFNDHFAIGQSFSYQGIGSYASAQYAAGLTLFHDAVDAFDKSGDLYETHLARFHRGCCYLGLGALDKAIADARQTFESSARFGDSRSLCASYLWARATQGNLPFERIQSCYPCRPDDIMSTVHGLMAEGHWHSFHGRSEQALQTFERAAKMIKQSLCVNSHTILVVPNLAAAQRARAEALRGTDPEQANELIKRAAKTAKWATRLTRLFPAAYPQSLRERSLVYAARNKTKRALNYAKKSCAVAEALGAKFEYAKSAVARARLRQQLGIPGADVQLDSAQAELDKFSQLAEEATARSAEVSPGRATTSGDV